VRSVGALMYNNFHTQNCYRHPVLLAVDDFQALYSRSNYRDPDFNPIQSHHLSTPRMLLEYAAGLKSFVNSLSLSCSPGYNVFLRHAVARCVFGGPIFYQYQLPPSFGVA
jgi:Mitochondrial ribosomal death-associated protein 3